MVQFFGGRVGARSLTLRHAAAVGVVAVVGASGLTGMEVAHAADLVVTTGADDGPGSLREAIEMANASPGGDVVQIGAGITVELLSPLEITSGISVVGAGPQETVISVDNEGLTSFGLGAFFVYDVAADPGFEELDFALSGVKLDGQGIAQIGVSVKGGLATIDDVVFTGFGDAGLVNNGSWERGEESLVVRSSVFQENSCGLRLETSGQQSVGVLVEDTVFDQNENRSGGGGICAWTMEDSRLTVLRSTFTDNVGASVGGAISLGYTHYLTGSHVLIEDTTFARNSTTNESGDSYGGAIGFSVMHTVLGGEASLTINRSTFTDDVADIGSDIGTPNGITGGSPSPSAGIFITNSTFSSPHPETNPDSANGSSIYVGRLFGNNQSAVFSLRNSTMVGGNVFINSIIGSGQERIDLQNTVIDSGDRPALTMSSPDPAYTEMLEEIITASGNAVTTTGIVPAGGALELTSEQMDLGDLANNGGITQTRLPGAALINAGDSAPKGLTLPETDQRGLPRVQGEGIGIGAVEMDLDVPPTPEQSTPPTEGPSTSLTEESTSPMGEPTASPALTPATDAAGRPGAGGQVSSTSTQVGGLAETGVGTASLAVAAVGGLVVGAGALVLLRQRRLG